jgi:hypothetical protein
MDRGLSATANAKRPACCHCGQALRAGEPHFTGDGNQRPWHYSCAQKAGLSLSWMLVRRRMAHLPETEV